MCGWRHGCHRTVRTLQLNTATAALGLNPSSSYAQLPAAFHRPAHQAPLRDAGVFAYNRTLAESLGLNPEATDESLLACFNSEQPPEGTSPLHMAYGGHQFGTWVPQLGDGRGLLLAEIPTPDGDTVDLHIKGTGTGHFSRGFDGRAVLRSTIREYLCSEAMHRLGIATTRALCLITSDEPVRRERIEQGALLVRVARTHVRFGTFEYFHYRDDSASVERLTEYVIKRHLPGSGASPAESLLQQAIVATARTVAGWQTVGFCHGVMNTDNMSILGETLDYGPFGFMDTYSPGHICNTSDQQGRYAYNRQPSVGLWNCRALAVAMSGLVADQRIKELLALYEPEFIRHYTAGMGRRLGLKDGGPEDLRLISGWLGLLAVSSMDMNLSFCRLCEALQQGQLQHFAEEFQSPEDFQKWCGRWLERGGDSGPDPALMQHNNARVILRNAYAQRAIVDAEGGDAGTFNELLRALESPFCEHHAYSRAPDAGQCDIRLSCSS